MKFISDFINIVQNLSEIAEDFQNFDRVGN